MKKTLAKAVLLAGGQTALASSIGVNPRTVRRWVAGDSTPTGLALAALKRYLTARA